MQERDAAAHPITSVRDRASPLGSVTATNAAIHRTSSSGQLHVRPLPEPSAGVHTALCKVRAYAGG